MMPASLRNFWLPTALTAVCLAVTAVAGSAIQGRGSFAGRFTATPRGGSQADIEILARGVVTHLGRSTVRIVSAADFGPAVPTALPPTTGVVTAANGDQVHFQIRWTLRPVAPAVFNVAGPYRVTGGTGRFANAGGEGFCTGRIDLGRGTAAADIAGIVVHQK